MTREGRLSVNEVLDWVQAHANGSSEEAAADLCDLLKSARNAALEESAQLADKFGVEGAAIAAEIRKLKAQ